MSKAAPGTSNAQSARLCGAKALRRSRDRPIVALVNRLLAAAFAPLALGTAKLGAKHLDINPQNMASRLPPAYLTSTLQTAKDVKLLTVRA